MKIIIAGATGYIGNAALQQAVSSQEITEIVVLARRDPKIEDEKVKTVLKTDFNAYTADELDQLKGASGCIWALGSAKSSLDIKMGYPRAALKAFTEHLVPAVPDKSPFRFVLLSGELVIPDQKRWVLPPLRVLQELGKLEVQWSEHERENAEVWKSFIARPGMVHDPGSMKVKILPSSAKIEKSVLGAALVDIVLHGNDQQTNGNVALNVIGKKALATAA